MKRLNFNLRNITYFYNSVNNLDTEEKKKRHQKGLWAFYRSLSKLSISELIEYKKKNNCEIVNWFFQSVFEIANPKNY